MQALNPDFFFRDGNNSGADLAEVSTRLTPDQAQYLREQADLCADPADTSNACNNVVGIVFFDFGTDAVPATYRDDMEFVTEQSITNPRMTGVIPDLGTSYLELTLDHTIHVRFLHNGNPASWTVTRHLTYHLVPSTGGSGTAWQIDNWRIEPTQDDLRDEATGQPIDG